MTVSFIIVNPIICLLYIYDTTHISKYSVNANNPEVQ